MAVIQINLACSCGKCLSIFKIYQLLESGDLCIRIQITLVLVFIFSRYWSKSIIRVPPGAPDN